MTPTEERVWAHILGDRQASPEDIAAACGTSPDVVTALLARISSPNWRDAPRAHPTFQKHDAYKPRLDLVPPELLVGMGEVLAYGARKYSANNWAEGADWGRYYAALMRHMVAWWSGSDADPESGMSHLHHAACCLAFLTAYQERGLGHDDRPHIHKKQETDDAADNLRHGDVL